MLDVLIGARRWAWLRQSTGILPWVLSTPATLQSHQSSEQIGAGPVVSLHLFFPLIFWNPSGVCRWLHQGDLQLACCQQCIRHSNNHPPGVWTQNVSTGLLIPPQGVLGEEAGGWMGLCKSLESKILVIQLLSLPWAHLKMPNLVHSICFLSKGCGFDSLPLPRLPW